MTRPSTPPILSELRSSTSSASQVAALRALKNEIIGHGQRKKTWVGLGVLSLLARILSTYRGNGKRPQRDVNRNSQSNAAESGRSDEEEARIQAIIIIGSLAHGGPAYIAPLNAANITSLLLAILSPHESSGPSILATLRTLNIIADSVSLEQESTGKDSNGLICQLYTEQHLTSISQLLLQESPSPVVQEQISLAATLVTKTCQEEHQRYQLAQFGILEALASRLAIFMHATDFVASPPYASPLNLSRSEVHPFLAKSVLAPVLECIGTIVQKSKTRGIQLLSAPALTSFVSQPSSDANTSPDRGVPAKNPYYPQSLSGRQPLSKPVESLLPQLPNSHYRGAVPQSSNFPPLGVPGSAAKQPQSARTFSSALEIIQNQAPDPSEDNEVPLVSWLIYIVRTGGSSNRLMAAWLLGILYRSGLTSKRREVGYALLLIPLLVRMLDKDPKIPVDPRRSHDAGPGSLDWLIKERAPCILAMLTIDNVDLQRSAVDAGAIKKLSQLLKESYDPLPSGLSVSLWTPEPRASPRKTTEDEITTLGPEGLSPVAHHVIQMRESVLVALASLASLKDEYRKAIIDNGVVPFVIESLKTSHKNLGSETMRNGSTDDKSTNQILPTEHPTKIILAACGAARSLSRSVSTLRTSLMDAGLAAPLFLLLRHHEIKVQIAATAVVCNLVLEFSPMREAILEAGILKVLCEHAHAVDANLRLNSVWALKHLVMTAPNSLKMSCLEELGPGWLKQIICDDSEDLAFTFGIRAEREMSSATPISMGTPNAAGQQVDLLNAVESRTKESSHAVDEDDEDLRMVDSIGALSRQDSHYRRNSLHARSELGQIGLRDADTGFLHHSQTDDLAVQKEGLDFIRNLICGDDAAEMIDYVFRELGQDKMFEIMMSKLRPRIVNAFNRDRNSSENRVRQVQPQTDIVIAVCYVLVHLAAGLPRHRQLLISQSELLKLIIPLFNHSHREVRGCCAWIVINLTWVDDQSDQQNCKARARELRKLGVYEKLEALESDPELDVRERTKNAIHQMNSLLR